MSDILSRLEAALADRYRVQRELGVGGMATVYLAHDLRHERDVAIKVLHPDLGAALGGERFLTEIRTTARLQHPHILPLLDSGEADGLLFYVMPYIAGETLRARLTREKVLPVGEAVRITREIASALDYAHRQQVIHRDIKPENILLHDGSALVADFGIALAVQQAGGARMTQTGLSLGTPQYMSPEQTMGERSLDARSDLYALGAMCYEMLTGDAPFTGTTVQAIVAKVMTEKPVPLRTVRDTVPVHVEQAVLACLAKLPADRPATAKEFAEALVNGSGAAVEQHRTASTSNGQVPRWSIGTLAGAAALVVVAAGGGWMLARMAGTSVAGALSTGPQQAYVTLSPELDETWNLNDGVASLAISPDGRRVVVTGRRGTRSGLLLRSLDSLGSRVLPGTEGARGPFWAPDGTMIGFFANGQLKVIDLATATQRALCPSTSRFGTWGANGVILYQAGGDKALHRTHATGGTCESVGSRLPAAARNIRPEFFSDGEHLLLTSNSAAWLTDTKLDTAVMLTQTDRRRSVTAGARHLAFHPIGSDGVVLQKVDFAERRLVGTPIKLSSDIQNPNGDLALSVSASGSLVADISRDAAGEYLLRVSRDGALIDSAKIPPEAYGRHRFSRDGQRIAYSGWRIAVGPRSGDAAADLVPFATPRRTFTNVAWSPGDTAVAFGVGRTSTDPGELRIASLSSGSVRTVYRQSGSRLANVLLTDWSRDGRYLVFTNQASTLGPLPEVWTFDLVESRAERRVWGEGAATQGTISPDGRVLAWAQVDASNESAVYVRPFPGPGVATRVSPGIGTAPRWNGRGDELYYVSGDLEIVSIRVSTSGAPLGPPRAMVPGSVLSGREPASFDVAPNDQSLIIKAGPPRTRPLVLLLNWPALLNSRANRP